MNSIKSMLLAVSLGVCSTVTFAEGPAPAKYPFRFARSCADEANVDLAYDLTNGTEPPVERGYIDRNSPNALKANDVNDTFGGLLQGSFDVVANVSQNYLEIDGHKKTLSKAAVRRARTLLREEPLLSQFPDLVEYKTDVVPGTFVFTCLLDSCPAGVSCSAVGLKKSGRKQLRELPNARRVFYKVLRLAKSVGYSELELKEWRIQFRKDENKFREQLAEIVDKTLYVSTEHVLMFDKGGR